MTEEQRLLADMADNLFGSLGPDACLERDWQAMEDVALPGLLLAEDLGGSGGSWEDALVAFRLAGYHALALPLPEAVIAAGLAGRGRARGTIASGVQGTIRDGTFSGTISGICFGLGADFVVAPCPEGGSMVIEATDLSMVSHRNLAGESRETATAQEARIERLRPDVFALGAFARVAQIAGALDSALARSVTYANERQQFGRALARFQAVQQNLAIFACEAAAANCAAMGAAQALARGAACFEIAAAKLRANRAVGIGAALAHQVHGAIGFTMEYPLHRLTRRLWTWRSEFGNDSRWAGALGAGIVARGADAFWPDLTALTD